MSYCLLLVSVRPVNEKLSPQIAVLPPNSSCSLQSATFNKSIIWRLQDIECTCNNISMFCPNNHAPQQLCSPNCHAPAKVSCFLQTAKQTCSLKNYWHYMPPQNIAEHWFLLQISFFSGMEHYYCSCGLELSLKFQYLLSNVPRPLKWPGNVL